MQNTSSYWSKLAQELVPYVPGEQPSSAQSWIKLNTNENPYPPSPKTLEAAVRAVNAALRLYPDPESTALRQALARHHGVEPSQVFVGNGSDEVLALCFQAFFDPGAAVRVPDITYFFYEVFARLYRITLDVVPLRDDFSLPVEAYYDSPGGVVFANPNAPTGKALSLDEIAHIAQRNARIVIVDEAYVNFGAESALALLARCPNIVVCRTFSKSHSLAGLRVGYAIASAEVIQALDRVKNAFNSFPLDRVAQAAAQAAIEDSAYYDDCTMKIIQTRDNTLQALVKRGFDVIPSVANFLFATHPAQDATQLQQALRQKHIIVRQFHRPRIDNYLRITIGTEPEMAALLAALDEIL